MIPVGHRVYTVDQLTSQRPPGSDPFLFLSEKDTRIAKAGRERPVPTLEQIRGAIISVIASSKQTEIAITGVTSMLTTLIGVVKSRRLIASRFRPNSTRSASSMSSRRSHSGGN